MTFNFESANDLAARLAERRPDPPKVAATRRMIEAAPPHRRDEAAAAAIAQAESPDEVMAVWRAAHETLDGLADRDFAAGWDG